MIINGFSSSSIASSVWANAARTLTNPSGIWSETTRNLSAMGSSLLTPSHVTNTVVSGGTQVDLRPAAGKSRNVSLAGLGSSTVAIQLGIWDGTSFITMAQSAVAAGIGLFLTGDSAVGPLVKLTGANSGAYQAYIEDWTQ